MKKFLLSLAVLACTASFANAEDVVLNSADATNIDGTEVAEKAAEGNSNGTARHYQPLNSLEIDGWKFTFSQGTNKNNAPAYYFPMSTNETGDKTIRVYNGNTATINAPEGKYFTNISIYTTDKKTTAIYSGKGTDTYTLTSTASLKIVSLTITLGAKDEEPTPEPTPDPTPTDGITVVKATAFEAGQYAFIFNEGVIGCIAEDKTYGYPMATAATISDEMTVAKESIYTFTKADDYYTITDVYGRFLGWDGEHWSFNVYKTATEGNCYWTVTVADGKAKIVNKAKSKDGNEVYISGKTYNSDYEMVPSDRDDQTLPFIYKVKDGSGIAEIEAAEAAEAVYYNLQGVKVAEPENGVYIRVQGNKSSKVLVRK